MSSIASIAPVLGAAAQLALVKSITTAMRAADKAAANASTSQPLRPEVVNQPSRKSDVTHVEVRPRVTPNANVRQHVVYLRPHVVPVQPTRHPAQTERPCPAIEPKHESLYPPPIWKFLPPPPPSSKMRHVKHVTPPPDISIKGSLIDIFV